MWWGFNPPTPNWCHCYEKHKDKGCRFWEQPERPHLSTCNRCEVVDIFCVGCERRDWCSKAKYPKIWPEVSAFLGRFNKARTLGQQVWGTDWRRVPFKEQQMIDVAMSEVLECEQRHAEQMRTDMELRRTSGR